MTEQHDQTQATPPEQDETAQDPQPQAEPDTEPAHDKEDAERKDTGQEDKHGKNANKEAAKYRTQLRQARTELEALEQQRNNLLRSAVEEQLPEEVPARLFWKVHDDPAAFMATDGTIDREQLRETVNQMREEFNLRKSPGPVIMAQGGTSRRINVNSNSITDAFRPRPR